MNASTRGKQWLTLVRFLLLFKLLLVCIPLLLECPLLFLELLLELGVGSLEVLHVILQEPCLSSPFLLQLVELPLQIQVLHLLVVDALFQSSEFLVTTHNCPQFF
jgi:hypothetical protein